MVKTQMNEWFRKRAVGQAEVARTLDVSVSTVSRILSGKQPLSMDRALSLHEQYGIPLCIIFPSLESDFELIRNSKEKSAVAS